MFSSVLLSWWGLELFAQPSDIYIYKFIFLYLHLFIYLYQSILYIYIYIYIYIQIWTHKYIYTYIHVYVCAYVCVCVCVCACVCTKPPDHLTNFIDFSIPFVVSLRVAFFTTPTFKKGWIWIPYSLYPSLYILRNPFHQTHFLSTLSFFQTFHLYWRRYHGPIETAVNFEKFFVACFYHIFLIVYNCRFQMITVVNSAAYDLKWQSHIYVYIYIYIYVCVCVCVCVCVIHFIACSLLVVSNTNDPLYIQLDIWGPLTRNNFKGNKHSTPQYPLLIHFFLKKDHSSLPYITGIWFWK